MYHPTGPVSPAKCFCSRVRTRDYARALWEGEDVAAPLRQGRVGGGRGPHRSPTSWTSGVCLPVPHGAPATVSTAAPKHLWDSGVWQRAIFLVNFLFVAVLWRGGEDEMENSLS